LPAVSVIIPAYNAAQYIEAAVQSMLQQTLQDIEIIIVDDASTDDTVAVVESIPDDRIILLQNDINLGVALSLNRAIQQCKAQLIARMDADDVSHSERLQVQVDYLNDHPELAAVDVLQQYMDDNGVGLNRTNEVITGSARIRKIMPWRNCLGHPSIMYRAEIVRKYKYRQIVYEDYDLWLRILNDGLEIDKLLRPLLAFRMHASSITARAQKINIHFSNIVKTKRYYLSNLSFRQRLSMFNINVMLSLIKDGATWYFKRLKNLVQNRP